MAHALNFQSIMMRLQDFWADYGCLIWQPYYVQVGAGTMNPGTILRVLGPEPWNVAYVEPSIRPDDGRYGENPNRMNKHYQFQVILKPDPGNPQEIYLQSLQALGIDPHQHDIRFVEDNWAQPMLGAWGLGWEVWLDGQEITQFTYFQQSGGQLLDPVSVELTYGLERIAIALQRVESFRDIQWSDELTDGDVNLQDEQEQSAYAFEVADVARLRQMFDLFESEANACLDNKLVLPAHDNVLKCSHTFNILDTRGAVGVTERQAYFGRMRDLARRVAEEYLQQRQRLEYPFLEETSTSRMGSSAAPKAHKSLSDLQLASLEAATFLLEIGSEELPSGDLERALEQLRERVPALLDELRLEHGQIQVLGTPRRQVVRVEEVAPRQTDLEQAVKGPPADRAFDSQGTPTKAAQGFARSKGLTVDDLEIRELDGGRYAVAVVRQEGLPAPQVLAEALPGLVESLHFERSMRWNASNVAYSRPLRWLLALYGEVELPFEYAGLVSGRTTRTLRFADTETLNVQNTDDYFQAMAQQGILLDPEERQRSIQEQIDKLAFRVGGQIAPDPDLLLEVTNLVEAPTALQGDFDPSHLDLPPEVLISVMKKHQRYFPVEKEGQLQPHFIFVANKPSHTAGACEGAETIIAGNEHVIRARFADAAYFVREDNKKTLVEFLPDLAKLTFQTQLGSMLDKSHRLRALVDDLASMMGLEDEVLETARRAAELCKADLASHMVVEMTSLQGVMGRYYALNSGENEAVAQAIFEHYLPRSAGDKGPSGLAGLAVGLADRLDSLAGLFAAGLAPTGSKDPFALRRAALGLVQNLLAWEMPLDLDSALGAAAGHLPIQAEQAALDDCLSFIIERLRNLLLEQGYRYDVVDAVLAIQGDNPAMAVKAVDELASWVERPEWEAILPAYSRCVRITRDQEQHYIFDPDVSIEPAERDLYNALMEAEAASRKVGSADDFIETFRPMIPVINRFFDEVLVMSEDREQRENRLALLQRIVELAEDVADFSKLEGF